MRKPKHQVQLDVVNRKEISGEERMVVRVTVRCRTKDGLASYIDIPVGEVNLRKRVAIAAGAIAEQHAQKYRDRSDPDECARVAEALFPHLGIPS